MMLTVNLRLRYLKPIDATLALYVNNEFRGKVDINQVNQIRIDVVKHILETNDVSILNTFYFVGHKSSNDVPGAEIKITMDEIGNLSNMPYEMDYVRRAMYTLMQLERRRVEKCI